MQKYSGTYSCALLMFMISLKYVRTLEEAQPAIYLQPRNFNPHPYAINAGPTNRVSPNNGPILFPPSPPPETEESNFIRIRTNDHPVDNHPYSKVAQKYRYTNPGRYQDYENQINPEIARALATHGKKVLGQPLLDTSGAAVPFIDVNNNYAFSYKVVDQLTGDDFSHSQSQNEKATSGEYRVKLPDGRVQIVSYTADKDGYKADVKYEDVAIIRGKPQHQKAVRLLRPADYAVQQIGSYKNDDGGYNDNLQQGYVYQLNGNHHGNLAQAAAFGPTPATPIHENLVEDYDYGGRNQNGYARSGPTQPNGVIYSVTQQPHPESFQHRPTILPQATPPAPSDLQYVPLDPRQRQQHRFRIIPQDKVEIVNQGVATSAVGSTVAPAYLENPGIILSTTASPPPFSGDYRHVFVTTIPDFYGGRKK